MFSKIKWNWIESNLRKIWIYVFTNRRAYIPILWIYFLTFPDNTIKQIWLYTALGSLVSFLFEIPSGYFSDKFGHKKTLILAKIFMLLSTLFFILWHDWVFFSIWSIFLSLWFAFTSGTMEAFVHEYLSESGKWTFFTKIWGRIGGSVSLFNSILIISIPFLVKINYILPFYVWLFFDIIWLFVAIFLIDTKKDKVIQKIKNIWSVIRQTKWSNFWPVAIFSIVLYWISSSTHAFRWPYLEYLWYPVVFIWFVMWFSRIIWFLVSRVLHKIEQNISIKKLLFWEIFMFSGSMFLISFLKNPYIVWLIFSVIIWYFWGRGPIIQNYIINQLPDKRYKATMLSVKNQFSELVNLILVIILWYIMNYSYSLWFMLLAVLLFVWLFLSYLFIRKKI